MSDQNDKDPGADKSSHKVPFVWQDAVVMDHSSLPFVGNPETLAHADALAAEVIAEHLAELKRKKNKT